MSKVVDYVYSKREDMLLFAAALAISVALFVQLQSGFVPDKERELDVPLTFSNRPEDMTVLQAPRTVRVLASGTQQVLDTIDSSRIRAFVDLNEAKPGVGRYRIEVTGPFRRGLTLTPVVGNAEIRLEAILKKEFEVELETSGTPPDGIAFTGATVFPSTVSVSGPESIVPQVLSVRAVFDLQNLEPNQTVEVELQALGAEGRPVPLVTLDPLRVQVSPAVEVGVSRRRLLVTPIFEGQPAVGSRVTGYSVTPNQVEVSGDSAEVSGVTTIDTEPIDLGAISTSRTFRVRLRVPNGLSLSGQNEVTVIVRVARS